MRPNNNQIKVLIVDDSAFMRKILTDMLSSDKTIRVIGTAKNGAEAVKLVKSLKPDVVTLDIKMPILNGIEALKQIMKDSPVPVIVLSSLTSDDADTTLKTLDIGAVDFIQKSSNIFRINMDEFKKELIDKIIAASKVKFVYEKYFIEIKKTKFPLSEGHRITQGLQKQHYFILIGASTGGPRALQYVLTSIPKDVPASILIVQHMPPVFTKSLAERLNNLCQITVKEAGNNERALLGHAYIAPGDHHLEINKISDENIFLSLSMAKQVSGHRPSVDVLFKSAANNLNKNVIGVIMTGMGTDGADGVRELKKNTECYIIAQDEETSVVYGMPRNAINTGVVDDIVPLHKIANYILKRLGV